jgi:hypothetical protein
VRKKNVPGILALLVLVIPLLLILTGCPYESTGTYGLKVIGDGQGGATAFYLEDQKIYIQKINPAGEKMWSEQGVLLGDTNGSFGFQSIHVLGTGGGGVIIGWPEATTKEPPVKSIYHLSSLAPDGTVVWQKDFEPFGRMVGNDSGGVIIEQSNSDDTLALVNIGSSGDFPWSENGVSLPSTGNRRTVVSDRAGGAIVIWQESHYPDWAEPGEARSTHSLHALRVNAAGELVWGDGVLVYDFPEDMWVDSFQAEGDGTGGAIITWLQVTEDPSAEPGRQQTWEIMVQRIDADGNIFWQPGGISLDTSGAGPSGLPMEPSVLGDGSSGAVVVWRELGRICAQKVDEDGNLMWQAGGVKVASTSKNPFPQIIGTGQGDIVVSYSFEEDRENLHVQKLGSNGDTLWAENGISVLEGEFSGQFIAPDGQGGAIVAWGVNKGLFSSEKAYVQRVSADGQLMWGEDGIRLNP